MATPNPRNGRRAQRKRGLPSLGLADAPQCTPRPSLSEERGRLSRPDRQLPENADKGSTGQGMRTSCARIDTTTRGFGDLPGPPCQEPKNWCAMDALGGDKAQPLGIRLHRKVRGYKAKRSNAQVRSTVQGIRCGCGSAHHRAKHPCNPSWYRRLRNPCAHHTAEV